MKLVEVSFNCVVTNSCPNSSREVAQALVSKIPEMSAPSENYDGVVTGTSSFGETVRIEAAENNPFIRIGRGALDQYRAGGVTFQ